MVIINALPSISGETILKYIPSRIRRYLYNDDLSNAEEIRIRIGHPVVIHKALKNDILYSGAKSKNPVIATRKDMEEGLELITGSSLYAAEDEIKDGYVTVEGGCRIGICGKCVIKNGDISFIKNISGLNYRFAREILTAAETIYNNVVTDGIVKNTLIISPPACGKTTMLRDLVRRISNSGKKVSVIDERREIAGISDGIPYFDLGSNTDVLEGSGKSDGMLMMLRSMSPDVIVTDEIGDEKDVYAIEQAVKCGVSVITSVHARNRAQAGSRSAISKILPYFECIITLSGRNGAGTVEEVWERCKS